MNGPVSKLARCAIYTRKSTEYNLELAFNSLDAQRDACEAYIKSQAHEGWRLIPGRYDDGAFSGASLDRPALQQLLAEVRAGKIDNCRCVSGDEHVEFAKSVSDGPTVKARYDLARIGVDVIDIADIAVIDLLVIVVFDLHDPCRWARMSIRTAAPCYHQRV